MKTLEEQALILALTQHVEQGECNDLTEIKEFLEKHFSIGELKRLGNGIDKLLCAVDEVLEDREESR